jgi:hypothetical protein
MSDNARSAADPLGQIAEEFVAAFRPCVAPAHCTPAIRRRLVVPSGSDGTPPTTAPRRR